MNVLGIEVARLAQGLGSLQVDDPVPGVAGGAVLHIHNVGGAIIDNVPDAVFALRNQAVAAGEIGFVEGIGGVQPALGIFFRGGPKKVEEVVPEGGGGIEMGKKMINGVCDGIQLPLHLGEGSLCLPNVRLHGAGLHVAVKNKDHDGHKGEDNDQVQQEGLPVNFQMQKVRQF